MSRYFLVQDPHHDYAVKFIEHIHQKYGYRALCFYSDRQQRIRQEAAFPALRSRAVAASYEVSTARLAEFAAYLRPRFDIAAVIPFNEPTVLAAATLAAHLQLSWSQPQVLPLFRDKQALKARLRHADPQLRVNAACIVNNINEVAEARRDAAYQRFVLKPNDGYGNRSIAMFDAESSPAQIAQYWRGAEQAVLMEEYIGGKEYFVNGQVDAAGHSTIIAIFEYQRIAANGRTNIDFETRCMASTQPLFAAISAYAERVLRATGLVRSPFHLELKVDERGPCLIEVAARLPGLNNAFLCEQLHGQFDWFDAAAHYYLDSSDYGPLPLDWQAYDSAAVRYVHGIATAKEQVYRLTGISETEALPEFHDWIKKPMRGNRFDITVDCLGMPWNLVLKAPSEAQADAAAAQVRTLIKWNHPHSRLLQLAISTWNFYRRCMTALRVRFILLTTPMNSRITVLRDDQGSLHAR